MNILMWAILIIVVIGCLFIYRISRKSGQMMSAAMDYAQRYGRIPYTELEKILIDPEFMTWSKEKITVISPDQIKAQGEARIFGQLFIDYYRERKFQDQQP